MSPIYWIIIFIVLLVIEIATLGLTTIWFAAGALVAFLAGILGFGIITQIVLFLVVSVVLLVLTRPIALKYFNNTRGEHDRAPGRGPGVHRHDKEPGTGGGGRGDLVRQDG